MIILFISFRCQKNQKHSLLLSVSFPFADPEHKRRWRKHPFLTAFWSSSLLCMIYPESAFPYSVVIKELLDIESVPLIRIRRVFVHGMLRQVILIRQKRSYASDLDDTFTAVHHGQLIDAHKISATLSSEEFKFLLKNPYFLHIIRLRR